MADDTGLAPKESVIETLCGWPDGLAVRGFHVSTSIPRVKLRRATPPGDLCAASLSHLFWPLSLVLSLAFSRTADLGSPATPAAFENMPAVQKTIQHGGDGGTIAEQLPPVFDWPVRCNQRAGSLVASHDDFQ